MSENEKNLMLPPAEKCSRCGKTLEQTGGLRLLIPRFWTEAEINAGGGSLKIIEDMHKGKRPMEGIQKVHAGWTSHDIELVENNIKIAEAEGRTPWECQRCANRVCKECFEPLKCPPISDILQDDGGVSHGPWFGYLAGCTNPKCIKFVKPGSV